MIIVLTKIPFLSLFLLVVCFFVYVLYGSPVYVIIKASIAETLGKGFQTNAGNSETEMTVIFCYSRFVFKEINVSFINN